jgi:hypothetical protein
MVFFEPFIGITCEHRTFWEIVKLITVLRAMAPTVYRTILYTRLPLQGRPFTERQEEQNYHVQDRHAHH